MRSYRDLCTITVLQGGELKIPTTFLQAPSFFGNLISTNYLVATNLPPDPFQSRITHG